MASDAAKVDALLARGRFKRPETVVLGFGAVAIALGAAAWIADPGQGSFAAAALPGNPQLSSFDDRFSPLSQPEASRGDVEVPAQDRFASATMELQLLDARGQLGRGLTSGQWRTSPLSGAQPPLSPALQTIEAAQAVDVAPPAQSGVPMPRPRPTTADTQAAVAQADALPQPEDRSFFQKLSDLLPSGKIRLASLTPDSGLFARGPDLAALGYDKQTAVYDISARKVYLPSGLTLEAHSGMGDLKDDPGHVQERMVGATPPATYELKPREKLFHGVPALRMTPVDGTTFGRTGLLAHSYMLGPNGDSNGCISFRDYERFLKAYTDGEVTRIVVVPALSSATQQARAASDS
jgi:type VI secretion system (T6SS) effector TldE1-like protein